MTIFDGLYNGLKFIVDPIFNPILELPPILSILIISIIIALITTFAYKWLTNQEEMKRLKEEQKELQKKVKEYKDNPQKMMETNKEAMAKSMKLMNASFKPMFITMIPIILIFMWLNLHLSYLPINPGQEFTSTVQFKQGTFGQITLIVPEEMTLHGNAMQDIIDDKAQWLLSGEAGEYILEYQYDERQYHKNLLITTEKAYENPVLPVKGSNIKSINIDQEKLKVNLGVMKLSWFWTYLIFTIIVSSTLRKLLKVY